MTPERKKKKKKTGDNDDDVALCSRITPERCYRVDGNGRLAIFTPKNTMLSQSFPK